MPRTLLTGKVVEETDSVVNKPSMRTRCPAKWLTLDLETGEVWDADGNLAGMAVVFGKKMEVSLLHKFFR